MQTRWTERPIQIACVLTYVHTHDSSRAAGPVAVPSETLLSTHRRWKTAGHFDDTSSPPLVATTCKPRSIHLLHKAMAPSRKGLPCPQSYQMNRHHARHCPRSPAFNPFRDPRLNARPWDLLRIRTNPVMGPSSPSFSILRFARASSPKTLRA